MYAKRRVQLVEDWQVLPFLARVFKARSEATAKRAAEKIADQIQVPTIAHQLSVFILSMFDVRPRTGLKGLIGLLGFIST